VVQAFFLFGNAVVFSVGTKNTAVAGQGLEDDATTGALVKDKSGIKWNIERLDSPTLGTGQVCVGNE
jgi:hypothetical protein